jgi:hypothetical protein
MPVIELPAEDAAHMLSVIGPAPAMTTKCLLSTRGGFASRARLADARSG